MEKKRVQVHFNEPSRTKQEFRDECNVVNIVRKYKNLSGCDYMKVQKTALGGRYGDFTNVVDYRTALDQVNEAQACFKALPSKVRRRFDDDASVFMDFVENPENKQACVELGLFGGEVKKAGENVQTQVK